MRGVIEASLPDVRFQPEFRTRFENRLLENFYRDDYQRVTGLRSNRDATKGSILSSVLEDNIATPREKETWIIVLLWFVSFGTCYGKINSNAILFRLFSQNSSPYSKTLYARVRSSKRYESIHGVAKSRKPTIPSFFDLRKWQIFEIWKLWTGHLLPAPFLLKRACIYCLFFVW